MGIPFSGVNTHHMPCTGLWACQSKFLEVKLILGPTDGPLDGTGWGGDLEVDFLLFLPLLDVILAN